ncbi:MAG: hypothetical protein IKV61_06880 [Clostridia bacterium]|nr:hypothetical protein [Clostridia bacterium]
MAMKLKKLFNTTKSKLFWLYIVFGALFTVLAVILMPFWKDANIDIFFAPWGYSIVKTVVAVALLLYVFLYLIKQLKKRTNNVVKVLGIIEFILLILIAAACLLNQFISFNVGTVGQILGFVLWIRGAIEVFRAYYYKDSESHSKYPVWQLFVTILLISVGTYSMFSNLLSDRAVLWAVTSIIALCGVISIILGFLKQPVRKAKKKVTKKEDKEEVKDELKDENK